MRYKNSYLILAFIAVSILSGAALQATTNAGANSQTVVNDAGVAAAQANKDVFSVEQIGAQLAKQSVEFEENRGQFDKRVRYQARGTGYSLFLTADEAVYVLPMPVSEDRESQVDNSNSPLLPDSSSPRLAFALRMKIVGANSESLYRGEEVREHRTNYFRGDNPENWQTDVPNYSRVLMQEVYPGVSMVWHGKEQSATQYDFVVEPNGNANQITLEFDGAERIEIDAEGNLLIHTEAGTIKQTKPFSYQETNGVRVEVESRFVLSEPFASADGLTRNPQIGFSLGEYDRSKPLTIDPYSTFMGGSGDDRGQSIAVDTAGNVYVSGSSQSPNYPTTAGAYDPTYNAGADVLVTKLNAAGSSLIYSTYIGGSGSGAGTDDDGGYGIAVDSSGNAFVTGHALSADYPTTPGAFDTTFNGQTDVVVTKLNANGSALIYSTFIGGGSISAFSGEFGRAIAVDSAGNAFVTGDTDSSDYPTTVGAFDTTFNNNADVFVTKLNAAGSALIYSTFIGGSRQDLPFGIAVDSSGNAFVTGETNSFIYPTTAGAFDTTYNGDSDVFVTKLNANGSALIYSTYIGNSSADRGFGIAVDSSGNAFVTGDTTSTNYPTTVGAFDTTYNTNSDVVVTKLNASGSALIYSTFIGGSDFDSGEGIAVDSSGNAFVTGATYGFNTAVAYPTTAGAFDTTHNGVSDVFVTRLNAAGSALIYSTFIGGNLTDIGEGIAVDSSGNAFVTGYAFSGNYPTTAGAFDTTYNGNYDVFVTSFSFPATAANVAVGGRVTVGKKGLARARVTLTDMNGETRSVLTNPFGFYRFDDVRAGETYIVSVNHKRYFFAAQVVSVTEDLTELNFMAEQLDNLIAVE